MKKILVLLLLMVILLFSSEGKGTSRLVVYNIVDLFGCPYDFTEQPDYFIFSIWREGFEEEVIHEDALSVHYEMVYTDSMLYSALMFNLSEFTTWEVGEHVYLFLKDIGGLKKVKNTKDLCAWNAIVIPEGGSAILIGFEEIPESIGSPIGMGSCGSIDENGYTPNSTNLKQNYPNPFNPTTTIEFDIENKGMVSLNIYNQEGKIVRNAVDNFMNAGKHSVGVDLSNLSAGTYYYILKVDGISEAKKMVLVK